MTHRAPVVASLRYRHYVLFLLTCVSIMNYVDRQLIGILSPEIKREFMLSDWQLGLVKGMVFALLYTLLGIPIARLADRYNRVSIIGLALATWSGFTVISGLVGNFVQLALTRFAVQIRKGHPACPLKLHDAITGNEFFKIIELVGVTIERNGDGIHPDRKDLALENAGELHHLAALFGCGPHGGQQQLALHAAARIELADLHHFDELEQLLGHLLQRRGLHIDHDGDATETLFLGRGDSEAVDVEATAGEQARHPGQHAGPVLHQHGQDVMVREVAHRRLPRFEFWKSGSSKSSLL